MMIDTSVVIDLFLNDESSHDFIKILDAIRKEDLFISVIQIGEVSDWCYRNRIDPSEALGFLRNICGVLPIDEGIMEEASRSKHSARSKGSKNFSLIDGIIFTTSIRYNEVLLTRDNDFRGMEGIVIV